MSNKGKYHNKPTLKESKEREKVLGELKDVEQALEDRSNKQKKNNKSRGN